MIHEFAVEPEVMATWDHFRVLWADFGVGKGRLLVEFPGSWRRRVYELAETLSSPVRAYTVRSRLADAAERRHRMVGPSGRDYDRERAWLNNAVAQQGSGQPFRAIVASRNPSGRADVLPAVEFDLEAEPWKVSTQVNDCPRVAAEMVARLATLLRHSEELVLVDRNFKTGIPRWRKPFKAFVAERPNWKRHWKRLELHTWRPDPCDLGVLQEEYQRWLGPAVPTGTTLIVLFWPRFPEGQQLHPRYVLTERGGALIDWGLDEAQSPTSTTFMALLEHGVFLELRQHYHKDGRTFGVPACINVEGRG